MSSALLLALFITFPSDPVSGSPDYAPQPGDKGMLHYYYADTGEIAKDIEVWTTIEAVAKYAAALNDPASRAERDKAGAGAAAYEAKEAIAVGQMARHKVAPTKSGELIRLPDKTALKVLATVEFFPYDPMLKDYAFQPMCLVELIDGQRKGQMAYVESYLIRVPGSVAPEQAGTASKEATSKGSQTGQTPPDDQIKIEIVSTKWTRKAGNAQVQLKIRNVSGTELEEASAKVLYQNAKGDLLSSSSIALGTLAAGETKSVSTSDKIESGTDRYDFEFEAKDKTTGSRGAIPFRTAKAGSKPAPAKRRR